MTEIVNLRRVRKRKARNAKEAQAEANRARHGTPKRERDLAKARAEKDARDVEGHKLDE
jgi:hypothetical protein